MSDWSHGYNVEQGYTYGAFKELSPEWLDFCASINGFLPPERANHFRYLELGSGQGVGLCILAACYPEADFVGVDFSPAHIAHSRFLAAEAGLKNIRFVEGDFAELSRQWPADMGSFQYVVLHGIYSWVPQDVRRELVGCLRHATQAGSLVYNSYNAMPGWAASMPLQHIMRRMQVANNCSGPEAIRQSQQLFDELEAADAALFKVYPTLKARLASNKKQNPAYLMQEYLHTEWHPFWFSQVAAEFENAKLSFIGSATVVENLMGSLLPERSRKIVDAQADPVLKQELFDCIVNQSFRRDLFCRGPRRPHIGLSSALEQPLALIQAPAEAGDVKIKTNFGQIGVKGSIQEEICAGLKSGPRSIKELRASPRLNKLNVANLAQAVSLLVHGGYITPARASHRQHAGAFNAAIARLASQTGAPYNYGAIPGFGGCIPMASTDLYLLDLYLRDRKLEAPQLVLELSRTMTRLKRSFAKDGKPADSAEAAQNLAQESVRSFLAKLPGWKRYGVFG